MTEHRPWRVGRSTGRAIYQHPGGNDDMIGAMDSRELAAQVVADHNAAPGLRAVQEAARGVLDVYPANDATPRMQALQSALAALAAAETPP